MVFSVCLQGVSRERQGHLAPSPGTLLSNPASTVAAWSCVCEHVCLSPTGCTHPFTRCALRYLKSRRGIILGGVGTL